MAKPIFLFYMFFLYHLAKPLSCGGAHDHISFGPSHKRSLLTRDTIYSPIRLTFYYYNFTLNNPDLENYFINTLIQQINSFFSAALQVKKIQGSLFMTGISTCGSEVEVPVSHQESGVENTDILIYITSNSLTGQSYVSYAGACALESSDLQNVYAGRVVVNSINFALASNENRYTIIVHEITHLLGFSSSLYGYWKDSSGMSYAKVLGVYTKRGASKTYLITPNVKSKAQEIFDCSTLEGMELEDQGSSSTALSHWDMRILINDFMIAHVANDLVYTTLTLALLKDTGWYDVNYTMGEMPIFGVDKKCDFFTTKCLENSLTKFPEYFCDTSSANLCDFNHLYKAYCNVATYTSALPSAFQYYTNTKKGGSDLYTDYCPYRQGFPDGSCRGNSLSTFINPLAAETISTKSRCFISTLVLKGNTIPTSGSACYEVTNCSADYATITISGSTIQCSLSSNVPEQKTVEGFDGFLTCPALGILCESIPCKDNCHGRGTCINQNCICLAGFSGETCSIICGENCASCNEMICLICLRVNMILEEDHCICDTGYILDSNGYCLSETRTCELLCGNCIIDPTFSVPAVCSGCVDYAVEDPVLMKCACQDPYYDSGFGSCLKCSDLCEKCTADGCLECVLNAKIDGVSCLCEDFYYKSDSGCLNCPSNCLRCPNSTNCDVCLDGFYLETNLGCSKCKDNCLKCNDYDQCSICNNNMYLYNGYCLLGCPSQTYNDDGSCYDCSMGYCKTCILEGKCLECIDGYILKNDTCYIQCPENCKNCTKIEICNECEDRFFLNDGMCYRCSIGCQKCSSNELCEECYGDYVLLNGYCDIECPDNCRNCTSVSLCNVCKNAHFKNAIGQCEPCPALCASCLSSTVCTTCASGYLLQSNACLPKCSDNCRTCLSGICLACNSGFSLKSGVCHINCPPNCKFCDYQGKCQSCNNGFYTNSGTCTKCESNCLTCTSPSKCQTCLKGYLLSNNQCLKS